MMPHRQVVSTLLVLCLAVLPGRDCFAAGFFRAPAPAAKATTEVLVNGGFESGRGVGWTESSSGNYQLVTSSGGLARTGSWWAWLGGFDNLNESVTQEVAIPADAQDARLTFWYRIATDEASSFEYDVLRITVVDAANGATLTETRLSNMNAAGAYLQAASHDLTPYRGRAVRVSFASTLDASLPTSFHIDDVSLLVTTAVTPPPASSSNYSDIWWNPDESGWGLTIADHETQLFAVWYTYRQDGSPTWFVIPGGTFSQGRRIFNGDAYQTTGSPYYAAFNPNAVTVTPVGSVAIDFAPPGQAAGTALFSYTIGSVSGSRYIQRQPFGNAAPAWGTDVTDIWWNQDESGWGLTLAQHGNNVFGVWFTYDAGGQPLFVVMPGVAFSGADSFSGELFTTRGPYFGTPFNASLVRVTPAGNATIDVQSILGQRRLRFRPVVFGSAVDRQVQRQPFGNAAPSQPPRSQTLTVSFGGNGSGRVTSSPAGIDCPGQCSAAYAQGTTVTLTAAPGATSRFASFTGTCSTPSTSCTLTMSASASVMATFEQLPPASTLAINAVSLREARPGQAYSELAATATGGQPPYSFLADTLANGAPPLGMGIDLNGFLTGTPSSTYTTRQTFTFGICVRDQVQTLKCTTNTVVVAPEAMSTVSWTMGDECNIPSPVSYKFYDRDRNLVWPSATTHYEIAFNATRSHTLACTAGALVCVGAQGGSYSWGVGFGGGGGCSNCCARCDGATYGYTFACDAPPPPPGSGGVTGTWSGTWNRTFGGFGSGSYSMTWTLGQSGSSVSGSWSWRFNSCDGLCPDPVGTTSSGTFATGSVSGSTLSLMTTGGTTFTGTVSGNSIAGTSGGSFPGNFTMSR